MDHNSRQGGTMLMVMVVLIALTSLMVGLFKLAERSGVENIYAIQSEQAFWLAESGLQQTLQKILNDESYRNACATSEAGADDPDGGSPYTVNIGGAGATGTWSLEIWRDALSNYNVIVEGNVQDSTRRLHNYVEFVPYLPYAVANTGGTMDIRDNVNIDGDIYAWTDVSLGNNVAVAGAITSGGLSASGTATYDSYTEITSPEVNLTFDVNYHDSEINDAANGTAGPWTSHDGDLTGQWINMNAYVNNTLYVNGNVNVNMPGGITYSGSGTARLVLSGNFTSNDHVTIDPNIEIIAGNDFTFHDASVIGSNVNVFAKNNLDFQGDMTGGGGQSSFVCDHNYSMKADIFYEGLIYCTANIEFQGYSDISGAVLGGKNLKFVNGADIEQNASTIPRKLFSSVFTIDKYTGITTWNQISTY